MPFCHCKANRRLRIAPLRMRLSVGARTASARSQPTILVISIAALRSYIGAMPTHTPAQALAEFKRAVAIIAVVAVAMVVVALTYLHFTSSLDANTVIATTLGVFFSVLLGCGLFAAAFFSDKSGHDQNVTDASKSERTRR